MTTDIRIRITDFRTGPKTARWFGGKYDAASKTWVLTGRNAALFAEKLASPHTRARCAGVEVVGTDGPCTYWTAAQGCPLHGELCGPERS